MRCIAPGKRNTQSLIIPGIMLVMAFCVNCASPVAAPQSSQSAIIEKTTVIPVNPTSAAVSTPAIPVNVSWSQAANYVGKTVTICGLVSGTHWANTSKGKPTFINMGKPYPDPNRFTVIIWDSNRVNFSQSPEKYYEGKNICVTGLIIQYNGMPEVEVKSPDQITVR